MIRDLRSGDSYLVKRAISTFFLKLFRGLLIGGLCFMILQPILNQLSVSLMHHDDLFDPTVVNVPANFSSANFSMAIMLMDYWATLARTIGVTFVVATLQIIACVLAAYGFARYEFPLKRFWFTCVILTIVIPPQTIMAPLYLNFRFFDIFGLFELFTGSSLNLLNNLGGYLILVATGMGLRSGLYIFMLRSTLGVCQKT